MNTQKYSLRIFLSIFVLSFTNKYTYFVYEYFGYVYLNVIKNIHFSFNIRSCCKKKKNEKRKCN